jgi:hypothetical protein
VSLRFRRRVKLFPGVHLNISRSGISTSVGVRGATMTFGKRGTYVNAGIPGSGISYRERLKPAEPRGVEQTIVSAPAAQPFHHHLHWWKVLLFLATMIAAGATNSNAIIGLCWICWFGYWAFLLVRRVIRSMRKTETLPAQP